MLVTCVYTEYASEMMVSRGLPWADTLTASDKNVTINFDGRMLSFEMSQDCVPCFLCPRTDHNTDLDQF